MPVHPVNRLTTAMEPTFGTWRLQATIRGAQYHNTEATSMTGAQKFMPPELPELAAISNMRLPPFEEPACLMAGTRSMFDPWPFA
jgi:hypothetical protein